MLTDWRVVLTKALKKKASDTSDKENSISRTKFTMNSVFVKKINRHA